VLACGMDMGSFKESTIVQRFSTPVDYEDVICKSSSRQAALSMLTWST